MRSEFPVGVAAFIGRKRERAKLADLIAKARIVTVTGSGGCGKTRLAKEVARDLESEFPDGAHWVDLQAVGEPVMVATAVAAAVGVPENPDEAAADALAARLAPRHLLLVVDNCEHLVDACAELIGDLVTVCPHLHVLCTSRVPLAVAGETTFELTGLPVPTSDASSVSAVAAADAARLFEIRARQVAPGFRMGEQNVSAVAEICERLDGIPLAIELAAARVRVLAPRQIAAGLSDRVGMLTGGVRRVPARQATLEASLDWSYDLLDDSQRLALARLSVFSGSFEIDAAEAVAGGVGIDEQLLLDVVTGLVEQSLLQVERREGTARYRLLETIRAYARNRLRELADPDRVRDRHLALYVGLADRARESLRGPEPESWMKRLSDELDDLRAAMVWAAETGDLRRLVELTEPIVRFWFERGLSEEVYKRLMESVERSTVAEGEQARALTTAALIALGSYRPTNAYHTAGQAIDAADGDSPDLQALARAVRVQAGAVTGLSTNEQVDGDIKEAVAVAGQSGDPAAKAYVLALNGWTSLRYRSVDAGSNLLEEAIDICETADVPFHLPAAHGCLGLWMGWSGQLDRTRHHAQKAVSIARRVGRPGWEAIGLAGRGAVDVLRGSHGDARRWLSQAETVLQRPGLEGTAYEAMFIQPWLAISAYAVGDWARTRTAAEEIIRIGRKRDDRWNVSVGEWLLGAAAVDQGHADAAQRHLENSREHSSDPDLPFPLGRSMLGLARLYGQDDLEEAWELAHGGLELLSDYGDRIGTTDVLELIADITGLRGDPEACLRLLAASEQFYVDTGLIRFPTQTDRFSQARYAAQAQLGTVTAKECWEEGTKMSLDDAVSYARRGRGERQRPQIGWESLTPMERDVVRLVAQDHTNAEIGEHLFISVNTVKKHLSHVYAKVDVDGRAGLAAEAARRDL